MEYIMPYSPRNTAAVFAGPAAGLRAVPGTFPQMSPGRSVILHFLIYYIRYIPQLYADTGPAAEEILSITYQKKMPLSSKPDSGIFSLTCFPADCIFPEKSPRFASVFPSHTQSEFHN